MPAMPPLLLVVLMGFGTQAIAEEERTLPALVLKPSTSLLPSLSAATTDHVSLGHSTDAVIGSLSLRSSALLFLRNNQVLVSANSSPAYVDQELDSHVLVQIEKEDASTHQDYNAEGRPRWLRFEYTQNNSQQNGLQSFSRRNQFVQTGIDTLNYGALSASVIQDQTQTISNASTSRFQSIHLSQRAMPFESGWLMHNDLGLIQTASPDIARRLGRVYVPNYSLIGASTQWLQGTRWHLSAATGSPNQTSLLNGSMQRTPGHLNYFASQYEANQEWRFAAQTLNGALATGTDGSLTQQHSDIKPYSSSWFASHYESPTLSWQANLTTSKDLENSAKGWWSDAVYIRSGDKHSFGAFRLDPHLKWGHLRMNADAQGGYWRMDQSNQRAQTNHALEYLKPVTGDLPATVYGFSSIRYRLNSISSILIGLGLRKDASNSSMFSTAYEQKLPDSGAWQLRADLLRNAMTQTQRFSLDRQWHWSEGERISTSVIHETVQAQGQALGSWIGQLSGGVTINHYLRWDGNARYIQSTHGAGQGLSSTLSWQIAKNWRLQNLVQWDVGRNNIPINTLSPIGQYLSTPVTSYQGRSLFFFLRYEERAGTQWVALDGRVDTPSGRIMGFVYLDQNANKRHDATEVVATNLTVTLNGRYQTRTDAAGKFEFASVAAGEHFITVQPDNLPLPWSVAQGGNYKVKVPARGTAWLEIAAQKE